MKTLVVLLDGAAEPEGSAYQKAKKPSLDSLASRGMCGLWEGPISPEGHNILSLSDLGMLGIFGYSLADSPGRGFMEALALGIETKPGVVYIRTNFGTVDDALAIVDRRAGRDASHLEEIARDLSTTIDGVSCRLVKGRGHRGIVILEGEGLSNKISDVDVKEERPAQVKPLEKEGEHTAQILNKYLEWSHSVLKEHPLNKKREIPANYLLLRSPGMAKPIQSFSQRYGIETGTVGNDTIFNGISQYLGMDIVTTSETSEVEDNLDEKREKALELLKQKDIVFLHIKGTDTFSHDKDLEGKVKFIEELDKKIFAQLPEGIAVAVISDHTTSSVSGEHCLGVIPFLIFNGKDANEVKTFDEFACKEGFFEKEPMKRILSLTQ